MPKEDMSETKQTAEEFFQACCLRKPWQWDRAHAVMSESEVEHYGDLRAKELLEEWWATGVEKWLEKGECKHPYEISVWSGHKRWNCDVCRKEALAMARAQGSWGRKA